MTHHARLLISADRVEVPGWLMKALGQRYAPYVNRTCRRWGTLWEGRFRSCLIPEETDRLAGPRDIEWNPVRAGLVAHPGEYRWSSYRANAQGGTNALVKPHPRYEGLGRDADGRQAAYRELFRHELAPGRVDEIRQATNGHFALGHERFAAPVSSVLGRRAARGKSGRPRKGPEPESGNLFPV